MKTKDLSVWIQQNDKLLESEKIHNLAAWVNVLMVFQSLLVDLETKFPPSYFKTKGFRI